ncbi:unnamed protein product [Phytomonas sp. Hart1]|nr:unnamed protein product [Phytomonas sp. Hart1]|eukprot:CCW70857.1 unnamed protein product [Phytomonas sp. isolate Hart1]
MSRSNVFGPNSLYSFTKFGAIPRSHAFEANKRTRDLFRLESQRHMQRDFNRERRYRFCVRCGITTVMVNFDCVPSARIGLWGRCVNDSDYTHHRFAQLTQREHARLTEWPVERRLNWWLYEREDAQ